MYFPSWRVLKCSKNYTRYLILFFIKIKFIIFLSVNYSIFNNKLK